MVKIKIRAFGKIAEILGKPELEWECSMQTDALRNALERKFPELKNAQYLLSVNKKIITTNSPLRQNDEVAMLPPFSGG